MNIPPDDRRKLEGIVARLASEHDGERAAAGLLLTRLLAKHKLRPEDMLNGGSSSRHSDELALRSMRNALEQAKRTLDRTRDELSRVSAVAVKESRDATKLRRQVNELEREVIRLRASAEAAPPPPPPEPEPPPFSADYEPWEDRTYSNAAGEARALLRLDVYWTPWERTFLDNLTAWRGRATPRQDEVLRNLRHKARQHNAARAAAAGIW
jgi:hypothetical protein